MSGQIDILMITHDRPAYTRLSLPRLLETCDESMRVWLWHNGEHGETLDVVRELANHPRVHEFHHSRENRMLREPTNWLWQHAEGEYLSKVDDDCLVPHGWAQKLRKAHEDVPALGVVGCWRFCDEDFNPSHAADKITPLPGGHQVLRSLWVEGSGYLLKRACLDQVGLLRRKESFSRHCIRIWAAGWLNGWYYPFLYQEHMDDPRSPNTLLRDDESFARNMPLTARKFGVSSLEGWTHWVREDARQLQTASLNPYEYLGWRPYLRRAVRALGLARATA